MSLQRTPSGLANLHLFFKVERIIYCEGGSPLNEEQIIHGGGDSDTLDVCFWQSVFRHFGSQSPSHFKSVGSKETLRSIALTVAAHQIGNVLTCFDSDHDDALGRKLQHPHVLYTRGYSWENDLFSDEPLETLFFRFRNRNQEADEAYAEAERVFGKFVQKAHKFCACDVYFIGKEKGGMFRRDAPQSAIETIRNSAPGLNESYLRLRLVDLGYKKIPTSRHRVRVNEVKDRLFGKILGKFVYRLISFFAPPKSGPFISYEMFMRTAIMRFEDSLRGGGLPNIRAHFNAIVP